MAGIAILKTLASFEFPEGEPKYTQEVHERIHKHLADLNGEDGVELMGIERILNDHPEFEKELEHVNFEE